MGGREVIFSGAHPRRVVVGLRPGAPGHAKPRPPIVVLVARLPCGAGAPGALRGSAPSGCRFCGLPCRDALPVLASGPTIPGGVLLSGPTSQAGWGRSVRRRSQVGLRASAGKALGLNDARRRPARPRPAPCQGAAGPRYHAGAGPSRARGLPLTAPLRCGHGRASPPKGGVFFCRKVSSKGEFCRI